MDTILNNKLAAFADKLKDTNSDLLSSMADAIKDRIDDTRQIPLTQGKYATVSAEDYEELMKYKWYYRNSDGYACRNVAAPDSPTYRSPSGATKSAQKVILMHRVILGATNRNLFVDHIDGDKTNNTRQNLRVTSPSINALNRSHRSGNATGYTGVRKRGNKYIALITIDRKGRYLGMFDTVEEASAAYIAARDSIINEAQ